uniref:FIP-RBD domain-containing protein n=1 Tax=Pavo cristatus TaxID=9049 RepID=A0A8C9EKC2_PAVCR
MRSNLTASMFDLSVKDKARSPFGKLKDKLKGKRSSGLSDTASAIVPSSAHSLADSEDEVCEKEKKKSKFKTLFSKPGLQKSSLSQSMSVLPTPQPVAARVRLRPTDFQPQWDDEDPETSPSSEREYAPSTLDSRQLNQPAAGNTKKEGLSLFSGLKSKSDPVSKSSLCINGSHVYMEESTLKDGTPASSPSPRNFRKKQVSASEENLSSRSAKGPEEVGRTSPSNALSGSSSLETFKAMSLPSYKLLSSEECVESSLPVSAEVTKETRKTEQKKSALLSLVTGRKEAAKPSDAESVPDRTQREEENKAAEEQSEQEAECPEPPAEFSRGNPQPEVFTSKLHPVKPMNTTANKSQSKDLNVISAMNEKLLEMNMKKYSPSDPAYAYAQLTHDELIQLVLKQKDAITKKDLQVRELEDYIDNLLVRVMEETPNILRISTSGTRKAGKM